MPFDHFDFIAGWYNRAAPFIPSERMLEWLALSREQSLLDAGGGTGRVAQALSRNVRKTVVVDLSLGMLHHAAEKGLASVRSAVESLPFRSGTFDRIVMVDAFHHVLDQRRTAKELWRVLAPGGRLLILEPDIHQFAVRGLALGEKLLLMRSHFLSGEQIAELFENQSGRCRVNYYERSVFIVYEK
ncbi:MAG TPA: class I SAM-dependent methyltransferase [Anaerolineales bacterium]|nr:class I SAM-dependent methyltransferase [Anaerolineales bacterium]